VGGIGRRTRGSGRVGKGVFGGCDFWGRGFGVVDTDLVFTVDACERLKSLNWRLERSKWSSL